MTKKYTLDFVFDDPQLNFTKVFKDREYYTTCTSFHGPAGMKVTTQAKQFLASFLEDSQQIGNYYIPEGVSIKVSEPDIEYGSSGYETIHYIPISRLKYITERIEEV